MRPRSAEGRSLAKTSTSCRGMEYTPAQYAVVHQQGTESIDLSAVDEHRDPEDDCRGVTVVDKIDLSVARSRPRRLGRHEPGFEDSGGVHAIDAERGGRWIERPSRASRGCTPGQKHVLRGRRRCGENSASECRISGRGADRVCDRVLSGVAGSGGQKVFCHRWDGARNASNDSSRVTTRRSLKSFLKRLRIRKVDRI